MSEPEDTPAARLRAALTAAVLPPTVRRAWTDRPPTPAPGQIWRARWGTTTQLLLILDAPSRSVRAVPVTLDLEAADDSAALLGPDSSELGGPLVVWLGDATALPLRVLDRYLGALTFELRALSAAGHGQPVLTDADDRAVLRARLQDALDVFVAAHWAPVTNGNLKEVLAATDPKELAQLLAVPPRTAIALRRGRTFLTLDQAERLAPVVHLPVETLLAANPPLPEELIADLDHPAYRAKVISLAERRGIDENQARLTAGFAVAAVAHRQTDGESPGWTDRLDRYFALVLDEQ